MTTIRLAVSGWAGTADLVVPRDASVDAVAKEYAQAMDLEEVPSLALLAGTVLSPDQLIHGLGLRHGSVLVALDDEVLESAEAAAGDAASARSRRTGGLTAVVLALAAGLSAAVASAYDGDWRLRAGCAAVLLVGAAIALWQRPGSGEVSRVAAPGLAAAGGFAGVYVDSTGGLLLATAVAGLAAGAAAALGRSDDERVDDLMRFWLVAAVILTGVAGTLLLLGAGANSLWAVLLAVAVLAAKLLPGSVVDVPDHLLLDLERLAVTAWSAHEKPTGSRRRRMTVNPESVADVVHRGHRRIDAVTVAVAAATLLSAPLLLTSADFGTAAIGAALEVFLAGAALTLMSRSYRARLPRTALRLSGVWCLVLVGLGLVVGGSETSTLATVGGLGFLAFLVLVAAVAMSNGWRSVWWARVGEILEELCIAFCLGALPVAAGLFAFVRALPS